ncbi:hypothetical protein BS17DRAFT_790948 [Gyrodon lividus]|nr:hypothetical protein BS17DRAFT_790948 [Gyrodon lividus]
MNLWFCLPRQGVSSIISLAAVPRVVFSWVGRFRNLPGLDPSNCVPHQRNQFDQRSMATAPMALCTWSLVTTYISVCW